MGAQNDEIVEPEEFFRDDDEPTPSSVELPEVIRQALAQPREFYYSLKTGEVNEGPQGSVRHRLGPYPTRKTAQEALERARQRDIKWEEDSRTYAREKE